MRWSQSVDRSPPIIEKLRGGENLGIGNSELAERILSRGAAAEGGDACKRHESVAAPFGGNVEIRQLFSVRLEVLKESFELVLHCVHLLAHVQNDFDSSEVYPEITCQGKNKLQSFEIRIGVKPGVTLRTRRFEKTFAFVQSQRLRMNAILIRNCADRVCLGFTCHAALYSNPISTRGFPVFSFEYSRSSSFVSSEITFGKLTCTSTN